MAMQEAGRDTDTFDFGSALENYLTPDFGEIEVGSIVKGEVVRVGDDNVLVDVSFKSEGQIPTSEFLDSAGNVTVKVGDKIDVYVDRKDESEGTVILSFEKAKRMQVFDQLEDVQENNKTISGRITRRIKGGYTVDIGGVDGMVHISDLSWSRIKTPAEVVKVGDTLDVYVISNARLCWRPSKRARLSPARPRTSPNTASSWTSVVWTAFCISPI